MTSLAAGAGTLAAALSAMLLAAPASAQRAGSPPPHATEGAPAWPVGIPEPGAPTVFIANLSDGATVSSPVTVVFGLMGMLVAPAGEGDEGTGHHHLLINSTLSPEALKEPIPADENHVHFGMGQHEVTLDLPPGDYRLQLVMGDANHVPHDPPVMSKPITITITVR